MYYLPYPAAYRYVPHMSCDAPVGIVSTALAVGVAGSILCVGEDDVDLLLKPLDGGAVLHYNQNLSISLNQDR